MAVLGIVGALILAACSDAVTGPQHGNGSIRRSLVGSAAVTACSDGTTNCFCSGGQSNLSSAINLSMSSGGCEEEYDCSEGWAGHPECDPYDCSLYPDRAGCDDDGGEGGTGGGPSQPEEYDYYSEADAGDDVSANENNAAGPGPRSSGGYYAPDVVERGTFTLDFVDQCGVRHYFYFIDARFERRTQSGRQDNGANGYKAYYALVGYSSYTAGLPDDYFLWATRVPITSTLRTQAGDDRWVGGFVQSNKATAKGHRLGRCYP